MLLFVSAALAQTPPPAAPDASQLEIEARNLQRLGVFEISSGIASMTGGLLLWTVGRPSGEVSTETQAIADARSLGGAALVIGGLLTSLVGGDTLGRAAARREAAAALAVTADLRGLQLHGTF